jgi:hypothetical protein
MRRFLLVLLVPILAVASAAASARTLRDVRGEVAEVRVEVRANGERWTVLALRTEDEGIEWLGLASESVLEAEEFSIDVGDRVRVRFFVDGDPHEVQRLRNETTGRVLRLRCLHGDPLWDRERRRGVGPGGPPRRGR